MKRVIINKGFSNSVVEYLNEGLKKSNGFKDCDELSDKNIYYFNTSVEAWALLEEMLRSFAFFFGYCYTVARNGNELLTINPA